MPAHAEDTCGLTRKLAEFAVGRGSDHLPEAVRHEATRAFVNWMGCVLGGCREDAASLAAKAIAVAAGGPKATVIGHDATSDLESAAFTNCISASALAFDDTHLATMTHPTGPVAAALFAWAESTRVSGVAFVEALAIGIEIQCRLSNALLLPPATPNLGLYITGVSGPVGAAAALGRLMGLDVTRMIWALGLAGAQASGFRATHGSMAGSIVPAFAARGGILAARLALSGVTCCENALEGPRGLLEVFSTGAVQENALKGLGSDFELCRLSYKPYPCGIVVHAAIDACLDAVSTGVDVSSIAHITLKVHPLAICLADRPNPGSALEAQVSLQHWTAIALLRARAGISEGKLEAVLDPAAAALRQRVHLQACDTFQRDEASVTLHLKDGSHTETHVSHASGSIGRPLSDDELDAKFLMQVSTTLRRSAADRLLFACRNLASAKCVGEELSPLLYKEAGTSV